MLVLEKMMERMGKITNFQLSMQLNHRHTFKSLLPTPL
jgi:hypothetical protein